MAVVRPVHEGAGRLFRLGGGGRRSDQPAADRQAARVRPGDVLTFPAGGTVRVIRVLGLAARRGPAPEARLLYEEVTEPGLREG
jgi:ribosome-associated heat shock protein Hsp15